MERNELRITPQSRYDASHTVQIKMKLNRKTDADILARLDAVGNKQGYIKRLIRADYEREYLAAVELAKIVLEDE